MFSFVLLIYMAEDITKDTSRIIKNGDTVSVNYVGKLEDGTIFDTSLKEVAIEAGTYNQMRNYAGDFTKYPASSLADYDENTYGISDGRDPAFGPNPEYYYDMNGSDTDIFVRFNVRSYHVNWPIPQSQIDAMGAENFPQNPGYSE